MSLGENAVRTEPPVTTNGKFLYILPRLVRPNETPLTRRIAGEVPSRLVRNAHIVKINRVFPLGTV